MEVMKYIDFLCMKKQLKKHCYLIKLFTIVPLLTVSVYGEATTLSERNNSKIVIIGAGISGLSSARYLTQHGYHPILLEAQDKVGGRIRTDRSLGVPFDEGASWVHAPKGNPITPIAKRAGAQTFVTDDDSVAVYDIDGSQYTEKQLNNAENRFNREIYHLNGQKNQSFAESFYNTFPNRHNNRLWTYMLSAFLEFDTGGDINQLSSIGFADDEMFSGDDVIITNGYDKVTDYLAKGLDIRLNTRVNRIDYSGKTITIEINNGSYQAEKVVVTVPLGVLKRGVIDFKPQLPAKTQKAIKGLQMGAVNKFLLVWDKKTLPKPFWNDNLQYIGFTPTEKGKFNYFLNVDKFIDRSADVSALMTFAFGEYSKQTEQMSDQAVIEEIMQHLQIIYANNHTPLPKPTGFLRTRWSSNPNAYGAYSFSTVGIGNWAFEAFEEPIENKIYFAGEHTIRDYRGTVHGAYLSGIRAAKAIIKE